MDVVEVITAFFLSDYLQKAEIVTWFTRSSLEIHCKILVRGNYCPSLTHVPLHILGHTRAQMLQYLLCLLLLELSHPSSSWKRCALVRFYSWCFTCSYQSLHKGDHQLAKNVKTQHFSFINRSKCINIFSTLFLKSHSHIRSFITDCFLFSRMAGQIKALLSCKNVKKTGTTLNERARWLPTFGGI